MSGMSGVELFFQFEHRLGESIIWHEAQQCLLWIDLYDPALFRHDPRLRKTEGRALAVAPPIGAVVATEDADLLLLSHCGGLSFLRISNLEITPYCDPEHGRDGIIYNDLKCDRWGRVWAGTSHALEKEPRGALWCVADKDQMALGDVGFAVSNGPAFSPDGRTMYFNDSVGRQTLAYDISPDDLHARNRRIVKTYAVEEGLPDGVIVDAEGMVWIAHWGGACVSRITPEGKTLASFPVPAQNVTTMCFAGPELRTLYITTARDGMDDKQLREWPLSGSVFKLDMDVAGLPEPLMRL